MWEWRVGAGRPQVPTIAWPGANASWQQGAWVVVALGAHFTYLYVWKTQGARALSTMSLDPTDVGRDDLHDISALVEKLQMLDTIWACQANALQNPYSRCR